MLKINGKALAVKPIEGMVEYVAKHGARTITVCDECDRACCAQGSFMCDDAYIAGIKEITVAEAAELGLEHFGYWKEEA